jgi:hypothetical protein
MSTVRDLLSELGFMVFEGALSDPPPPICPYALCDEMRDHLAAEWCEGGPYLFFTLIAESRVYTVIPHPCVRREVIKDAMPRLITEVGADRYVYVAESWISDRKDCRPTDDSNHKEVLVIGAVDIKGQSGSGYFEITRDADGRASLASWHSMAGEAQSWMLELFRYYATTLAVH